MQALPAPIAMSAAHAMIATASEQGLALVHLSDELESTFGGTSLLVVSVAAPIITELHKTGKTGVSGGVGKWGAGVRPCLQARFAHGVAGVDGARRAPGRGDHRLR